jgi:hypothetical protein
MSVLRPLPKHVKYADLRLDFVSPSITVLSICFFLDEKTARGPLEILRSYRRSIFKALGWRGHTVITPEFLKQREISKLRRELRQEIWTWLGRYFPGVFAGSPVDRLPVLELLLVENLKNAASVRTCLGARGFLPWMSKKWPGVSLISPLNGEDEDLYHGILLADREALATVDVKSYGGGRDVFPWVFEHSVRPFTARWSLLSAIEEFMARLNRLRDHNLGVLNKRAGTAITRLQEMTLESVDISSVARDLRDFDDKHRWDRSESMDLERTITTGEKVTTHSFGEQLRFAVAHQARALGELDANIKTYAMQQGTLLLSAQNLALQRWVGFATALAVLLAATSAFEPSTKIISQLRCVASGGRWESVATNAGVCRPSR